LKKRKLYQAEQEKISQVKMTLETQAIHLESASSTADAFHAMSAGNKTMQKIRNDMGGVENVDDLMVDIQEEMQMAEEVNTALGQGIDPMMGAMDDDELMMELEELQQSDLQSKLDTAQLGTGNQMLYSLPQAPQSSLTRKEEEDYKRLQAELAL
jgi:charged multivesicular body protein 4A/B